MVYLDLKLQPSEQAVFKAGLLLSSLSANFAA